MEQLQQAIKKLMANDKNGTWDEVASIDELKECLLSAMEDYEETEETYKFYESILVDLNGIGTKTIKMLASRINLLVADENIISEIEKILPKGYSITRAMELYEEEVWEVNSNEGIAVIKVILEETTTNPDGSEINLRAEII